MNSTITSRPITKVKMKKEELIKSAKLLKTPSKESFEEFIAKSGAAVSQLNEMLCQNNGLNNLIGEDNVELMLDNHKNHAQFMQAVFETYDPQVFVDTIDWVLGVYMRRGFTIEYWDYQLSGWIDIYRKLLSEKAFNEIFPFYDWMRNNIRNFRE